MTRKNGTANPLDDAVASEAATPERHRKHARLKTRAVARLSLENQAPVLCEIQDFSQQGIQLGKLDGPGARAIQGAMPGSRARVEIEFPLSEGGVGDFKLHGSLVHATSSAFGLKLDDMTQEAYLALAHARLTHLHPRPPASGLLPEEVQAILRDCLHLFHLFLDHAWRDFVDGIAIKVASRDTGTLPLVDHSRYLGALANLLQHSNTLGKAHYASLVRAMHRIDEPHVEPERLPANASELSLVDDNSFEDWLNIAHVFNRIEADNRSAMFQFEQRLERLMPVAIDRHNDPFGPESVCLAFQETIRHLDLNNEMRGMLYRAYGETIQPHFPGFFEQLNLLLAPLKPAPPQPARNADKPGRDRTASTEPPADGTQPATPEEIASQLGKLAEIAEQLFAASPMASRAAESAATATPAQAGGIDAPVAATGSSSAQANTHPAFQAADLAQLLRQTLAMLATRPVAPEGLPQATLTAEAARAEPPPALDHLLARAPGPVSLTRQVSQLLDSGESAGLSEQHRATLSVASNLMAQAMTEHAELSDIDSLIRKLEKPLYEMVLEGQDPLNQPDHPLRRLLNLIDRFSIVADDRGQIMERELGDLLTTVIDQAAEDPGNLTKASDALEKLLKYPVQFHRQRVSSHQEICEAQHLVRGAKLTVAGELDRRLSGRIAPRMVINLLDRGLRQYLVQQTLRGNQAGLDSAYALIESLMAPDTSELASLASGVESRLRAITTDNRLIEDCLADLDVYLDQPEKRDTVRLPENWFRNEAEPDGNDRPETWASADLPASIGEWWETEQDGLVTPMQLIWIADPPVSFGFVNRAATRNILMGAAEIARRQAAGTLRRGENRDQPLLERSQNATIDKLYRRLAHRAHHDPATDLLNSKGLMFTASRQPNRSGNGHVLCMLEFVPFRAIVDTCGIEAGERLMHELSVLVRRRLSQHPLAVAGDGRFALLLADTDAIAAQTQLESLIQAMQGFHFRHEEAHYVISVHAGLAGLLPGFIDPDEALRRAVAACSVAVSNGKPVQCYEDTDEQLREQEALLKWGQRIDSLLAGNELFLRCQAITPLASDATTLPYYEVLLGLRDDAGQVISPQPFVEAVEYWKRAHDLDLWVIERTFAWIRANRDTFDRLGGFSINLSALSMSDDGILARLHEHLGQGDVQTDKIVFEITETATVGNYDSAREFIRQIRRYGCRFCIDDFGSGNASYGYLRNLRTDTLKIDGVFVKDMVTDPDLLAMVKSMNDIAHSLGMKTVAEFVANPEILDLAKEIGVDYGQGYEIARPVHIDELIEAVPA